MKACSTRIVGRQKPLAVTHLDCSVCNINGFVLFLCEASCRSRTIKSLCRAGPISTLRTFLKKGSAPNRLVDHVLQQQIALGAYEANAPSQHYLQDRRCGQRSLARNFVFRKEMLTPDERAKCVVNAGIVEVWTWTNTLAVTGGHHAAGRLRKHVRKADRAVSRSPLSTKGAPWEERKRWV